MRGQRSLRRGWKGTTDVPRGEVGEDGEHGCALSSHAMEARRGDFKASGASIIRETKSQGCFHRLRINARIALPSRSLPEGLSRLVDRR